MHGLTFTSCKQVKFFSQYLIDEFNHNRAIKLKDVVPTLLEMPWRDNVNKVDCGVYLMRHMETYTGKDFASWDCGFIKESKKGISNLRIKYAHILLLSVLNEMRVVLMNNVKKYAKECAAQNKKVSKKKP